MNNHYDNSNSSIKELESEIAEINAEIAPYDTADISSHSKEPDAVKFSDNTENIKADRRETIEILEEQIEREKKRR